MRVALWLPLLTAVVAVASTLGVVERLSTLDGDSTVDLDGLAAGNVHALWLDGLTWQCALGAWCVPHYWTALLRLDSALLMAVLFAGIAVRSRRRERAQPAITAWSCLAVAALPWMLCYVAVRQVEQLHDVGPWLARMLSALLLGSLACAFTAARALLRGRRVQPHATAPALAH